MTPDINSRARQLLADIGIRERFGDSPKIVAQYERLVAFVAEHLRQVAAEAPETALKEAAAPVKILRSVTLADGIYDLTRRE